MATGKEIAFEGFCGHQISEQTTYFLVCIASELPFRSWGKFPERNSLDRACIDQRTL